jgi:hypothetical protein
MTQELLEAAFSLAREHGKSFPGPAKARKLMHDRFPSVGESPYASPFFEAYDLGLALLDEGCKEAELCRENGKREADAVASLRAQCPGFSVETYKKALAEGFFTTR